VIYPCETNKNLTEQQDHLSFHYSNQCITSFSNLSQKAIKIHALSVLKATNQLVNVSFKGKVITITGAASGIARETAILLALKDAKVFLVDVQEEALKETANLIKQDGGEAIAVTVDITNRKQVEDWIEKTVTTFGKIDGAANLAGAIRKNINITHIQDVDDDDWDFVYQVNLKGLLNCLRAQIPHLKENGGAVVNTGSVACIIGFPRNAAYVAAKHGVVGLSKAAAKELGPKGIRCNCICPYVKTPVLVLDTEQIC